MLSLFVLTAVACGSSSPGGTGGAGGATGGAGGSGATFPCPKQGSAQRQCQHGLEYCRLTSSGSTSCEALPAACGSTPSCSCIPLFFPTCDSCTQSASGDIEAFFALDCSQP